VRVFSSRISIFIYNEAINNNIDINKYIEDNRPALLKLKDSYKENNNEMISGNMAMMSFLLICITLIYYLYFQDYIDAKPTIIQTIIIFIFVGIIELIFFFVIALKYAPVDMTFLINEIKSDLLTNPILNT